ncbi:MAG: OsmC family protein [Thermodesulfovibrionales bacterium]
MEIKITFPGGKKVNAELDGFTIKTDQPIKYGGENSAPSPFDHFLASIGTCAGIYVLSFCEGRKIPTENISLVQRLEYDKTPDGKTFIDKIVLEIIIPHDFPEKYHQALIKVADQCAVKKAIMNPPKFEVKTLVK